MAHGLEATAEHRVSHRVRQTGWEDLSKEVTFKEEESLKARQPRDKLDRARGGRMLSAEKGQPEQRLRKGSRLEHQSSRKAIEAVPGPGEAGRGQVCWGLWVRENGRFYSMDERMSWTDLS